MRKAFKLYTISPLFLLGAAAFVVYALAGASGMLLSYVSYAAFVDTWQYYTCQAFVFATVFVGCGYGLGLYRWEVALSFDTAFRRLCITFLGGLLALAFIYYVFPATKIWRGGIAWSVPLAFIGNAALHYAFLRMPDLALFRRRVLVIGVGDRAARIAQLEGRGRASRFVCIGFMDVASEERKVDEDRIFGNVNSLPDFVHENRVDEIVVATSDRRGCLPLQRLIDCRLAGTPIRTYHEFFEREARHIDLNALVPDWFLYSDGFLLGWWKPRLKRALDLVTSVVLLLLSAPVMVLIALAIRLDSAGPVLFRQTRVGFRGEDFTILKFRSMRVDAEKDGVPQWAKRNDDRVTRVGRFIRATRLDELPQLFNVLKGDMSMVGPRPERPYFVAELCRVIPYFEQRHRVRPGITGWAQVNYPYGASTDDAARKLEYDLYYAKFYSAFYDIMILIQTLRVVIWPHRMHT